jgi:CRP-like cAMP-binding protein
MTNTTLDMDIRKAALRNQACFSELADQELIELAGLLKEKHFSPGETIVTEGDLIDSFFLIISGTANVKAINKSVATIGPGDSIGLNATGFYSLTGKRTATVIASSDLLALSMSVALFHGFALANHHVNEVMRKSAAVILKNPKI